MSMWSHFGYEYHSYLIVKHILPEIEIPKSGKIIQMGCGLGLAIERLCCIYGEDRVVGYDLFNPLLHPNIKFLDTSLHAPEDEDIAFLEIDISSMSDAIDKRRELLKWAMNNVKKGGYILTNRKLAVELNDNPDYNFKIIDLHSFDSPRLWNNVYNNRLNSKVLLKVLETRKKNG